MKAKLAKIINCLKSSFVFIIMILLVLIPATTAITLDNQTGVIMNRTNPVRISNQNNLKSSLNSQHISAQTLNTNLSRLIFEIYIDILPNGKDVQVSAHYTYQNEGNTSINNIINILDVSSVLIESRLSSIAVFDAVGELYYEWALDVYTHLINVTLREPLESQDIYTYTITYLLEDAILRGFELLEAFVLQLSITHEEDIEQFTVIATLPAQYELYNQSALEPDADYMSVDGKRFEWNIYNVLEDATHLWIIRFQIFQVTTIPPPPPNKAAWYGMIGTFFFGLIAGGLTVFFIIKSRTDIERKEIVETLLSPPEKEIIRIIKNENGVTTQSKICSVSGFSKAKVSYYLNELENKGIVEKERWGRMNRIRIVDDSVDKAYAKETE